MKHTCCTVAATLIGGLLTGAALAMLFTPQSGPDMRKHIKELFGKEIDRVKEKISEVEEQLDAARCRCND